MNDYHTAKHNRDVELTDLLAEIGEKYGDTFTYAELARIRELTKPTD